MMGIISTAVISLCLAAVLLLAVRRMIRDKKAGRGLSCSCSCEGCAMRNTCHAKEKNE